MGNDGTHGNELWRSDGTETGTVMVMDLYRGAEGSYPSWITVSGGAVFISAQTRRFGTELWRVLG